MSYLIDTHIFLWLLFEPKKVPLSKLKILQDGKNTVYISSISFWEISLKFSLGKLFLEGVTPEKLPSLAVQMGLEIIDATADELSCIHQLPNYHKDPFDRIIIHQAISRKITLVSVDGKFEAYKEHGLMLI